jgi:hypothetical protein
MRETVHGRAGEHGIGPRLRTQTEPSPAITLKGCVTGMRTPTEGGPPGVAVGAWPVHPTSAPRARRPPATGSPAVVPSLPPVARMAPRVTPQARTRFRRGPGPRERNRSGTATVERHDAEGRRHARDRVCRRHLGPVGDRRWAQRRAAPRAPAGVRRGGVELVSLSFNLDIVRHGPSHLLVFKRAGGVSSNASG